MKEFFARASRRRASTLTVLLASISIGAGNLAARDKNGFNLEGAIVPAREIVSGGPPRDGIPALSRPKFVTAAKADFLEPSDRVLGIALGGQAKAYPIRILNWHEIVNDQIGSQYFTVTYCPLCGTGMAFAANSGKGALIFGVSGLLYNSDMLLYDRNTESLWSQILARAVAGPLVGIELPQLPVTHTTWQAWQVRHPDTVVLSTNTGYSRNYSQSPYRGYERTPQLYFDVAHRAPGDYHAKALVIGIDVDGVYKTYPFEELEAVAGGRVLDRVNGKNLIVVWDGASQTAEVYGEDDQLYPGVVAYWFAWYAFYPETLVFKSADCKADLPDSCSLRENMRH